jgi:hypothetical protein
MRIVILIIFSVFATFSNILGQGGNRFQLLLELSESCGEESINFEDYPNWYGIYLTDTGEYIKKINIEYHLMTEPEEDIKNISYIGKNIFWTNQQERAYIIIGTNIDIKDHRASYHGREFFNHTNLIYPGQRKTLYTFNRLPQRKSFELSAIGCVDSYDFSPIFSDYTLQISNKEEKWKSQNISKHVDFRGETDMIDLKWFGDIDFDGIPDIILSRNSNAEAWLYLFLSSEATEDEYVRFVSKFGIGNCM